MTKIQETGDKVLANVERVIVGKHHEVRLALVALLCRGHLLIEDVPGTGKTVLAKAIARSLGCSFRRIQFTPDLLPSDVTGLSIYNQKTQEFEFRPGPIMSQVVLADEINRATPKTQSSLLECMEERQATIDGITHPMPDPFLVIATQNPIEYEGTFALPEAQLDRFMLRIRLGYPQPIEEIVILDEQKRTHPLEDLEEVLGVEELRDLQDAVREIYVDSTVADYIVRVVGATRSHPDVYLGASPRGSIALYRAGQALAGLLGRDYVIPDDIKALAEPALAHRLIIKTSSSIHDVQAGQVVREILDSTVDRRHPPDRRRPDRPASGDAPAEPGAERLGGRRTDRVEQDADRCSDASRPWPSPTILVVAAFSTGCAVPVLPALPGDPRRRRVVRPRPARPVGPRGGLRRQPAARPRRRPDAGHLHAAQQQPPAQAVARGPQPDDAARRPARPRHLARRPQRAVVARSARRSTRRGHFRIEPLHIRTGDPFGFFEAAGDGRAGGQRRRLPAARAAADVAPAGGQPRGQPRLARAHPPDDAAGHDRPAVRPGRQHEPDPLAVDRPPRRDPGQGVRPRADGRRLDHPRPPARRPGRARRRVDDRGRPSAPPHRSPTRR